MTSHQYVDCESCACFLSRRMTRHLTQFFDQRLKSTGLRSTQFSALAALIRLAIPTPINRLANVLGTDRTTLTRSLEHLEAQGLVAIQAGEDRRTRIINITPEGRASVRRAYPVWKKAQTDVEGHLSVEALKHLATMAGHI